MSHTKVIIIGAGGHAAEIEEYIQYNNKVDSLENVEIVGLIDDNPANYEHYAFVAPYLGPIKGHVLDESAYYVMGIANLVYRKPIIENFISMGAKFLTIVHATAFVSPRASIGQGCVIAPFVNVGPKVIIGDFNLLNSRASIGHDTSIGKYNFICPNVSFSGHTVVGDNNLFGINSASIPGIKVGDNNKIAAAMTLDKNVGDNETIFYRFKEKVIAVSK